MVKLPSKHGLERKFKPWRRGKSAKSNKRSSLKHQLRGHERTLAKLQKTNENPKQQAELQAKIATIKQEMQQKQQTTIEKEKSQKAHGKRFMDRQKLTRQEKKVRQEIIILMQEEKRKKSKSNNKANNNYLKEYDNQLLKLALDQVYVAHHPSDVKYIPLFKNGVRVVDQSRQLYRRAMTRRRILKEISTMKQTNDSGSNFDNNINNNNNWISSDQYKRLPKDWSIQDEERVFGGSITRSAINQASNKHDKTTAKADSRFAVSSQHEKLLQAADLVEKELEEEHENNIEHEKGNDSDDIIDANSLRQQLDKKTSAKNDSDSDSDDNDDSSNDESSSNDDEKRLKVATKKNAKATKTTKLETKIDGTKSDDDDGDDDDDTDSSSSSSTSSSSSSATSSSSVSTNQRSDKTKPELKNRTQEEKLMSNNANNNTNEGKVDDNDVEDDPFLMDTTDDAVDVFDKAARAVPALEAKGDKSKGWATQKQRPGQWKKRKRRN